MKLINPYYSKRLFNYIQMQSGLQETAFKIVENKIYIVSFSDQFPFLYKKKKNHRHNFSTSSTSDFQHSYSHRFKNGKESETKKMKKLSNEQIQVKVKSKSKRSRSWRTRGMETWCSESGLHCMSCEICSSRSKFDSADGNELAPISLLRDWIRGKSKP